MAIKMRKRTYWTTETFKEEMKKRNPNIEILGEYINNSTKVHCKCLLDNYEWDTAPSNLLSNRGCPKCGGKLKKTHNDFIEEFYSKSEQPYTIEIVGEYKNAKTPIKCICKIDNHIWFARPYDLLNGHGCPKCCKSTKKTHEEFLLAFSKMENSNKIEILDEYINSDTKMLVRCKIDNYKWYSSSHKLLSGYGCPVCSSKITAKGINDVATLRPDLVKYFDNITDTYTYTTGSRKKVKLHCIDCGRSKIMSVDRLSKKGFSCAYCSDGVSYPNKFSRAFLLQLPIENLITEYHPEWANGRFYDNYFEYNNKKYILEMDGSFHYMDNKMNGQTKEMSKFIDSMKDNLAYKHGINVIRIDCRESNKEYIANNLLSSELSNLFNLSEINWKKCDEYATSNIIKQVCELYNNVTQSSAEISKYLGIGQHIVPRYLNKGTELGWCNYKGDDVCKIMYEPMVAKDKFGNIITEAQNVYEMIEQLKILFPKVNFTRSSIRYVCKGKMSKHKGLIFEYIT